jgi:hypothetical protein
MNYRTGGINQLRQLKLNDESDLNVYSQEFAERRFADSR